MAESKLASFLQEAPRVAGSLVALVYGTGFMVVTLYLAQFGITEFSFVRSQIFLAGALFVFLTAIPAYSALHLFGQIGPKGLEVPGGRPVGHLTLYKIECAISFYVLCFALASTSIMLFPVFPIQRTWGMWSSLALLIPFLVSAVLAHWFFDRYWFVFLPVSLVINAALVIIVFHCFSRPFFWLTLWFYVAGIGALTLSYAAHDPGVRGGLRWEMVPLWLLGWIAFYSLLVYGTLKPQFGGGAPAPVVIYTSTKMPIFESDSAQVLLLHETDRGYYFLLQSSRKPAYFIRRDLVTVLTFTDTAKK